MSEHDEQVYLFDWARAHESRIPALRLLFAVPNAGCGGNARLAARFSREGLRAGVPDVVLAVPVKPWHGLFLELKSPKGYLRPEQRVMLDALSRVGYRAEVVRSGAAAVDVVREYLGV